MPVNTSAEKKLGQGQIEADEALVAKAKNGYTRAFEELVRRYRNDVFALSFHFVHNREEAWDISQEVFIKAYRSLKRFRGEAGFKSWLMRIAANHCKDTLKKRRLPTVPFDDALAGKKANGMADPGSQVRAKELGEAIQAAVDGLPAKQRVAFVLREYEDMSYKEMADMMGCSEGTVMSRLHHARKKLQNALMEMGVVEDI